MNWTSLRERFPAVRELAYLDTASYGPTPLAALERMHACLDEVAYGTGDWRAFEEDGEVARRNFARILGCASESIALLPASSVAAAQVARGLELEAGASVVVGDGEFRSNLYPWLGLRERGVDVRLVPFENGRIPAARLLEACDASTALVAVSHVQSANGYRVDLAALTAGLSGTQTRLFLDATQSAGALRIPLAGVDYLAAAAYKWLLGPRGCAFLYVAPERIRELAPLAPGWKTPRDPYAGYYGPPLDVPDDASRFDVSLAWPLWGGMAAATGLVAELGVDAIEARDTALADRFVAGLEPLGLAPLFEPAECSPIIGLEVPDADALRVELQRQGVRAAVRDRYLRVCFHFFNDSSDVDRALSALGEHARADERAS